MSVALTVRLGLMRVIHLAERAVSTLSGGEKVEGIVLSAQYGQSCFTLNSLHEYIESQRLPVLSSQRSHSAAFPTVIKIEHRLALAS